MRPFEIVRWRSLTYLVLCLMKETMHPTLADYFNGCFYSVELSSTPKNYLQENYELFARKLRIIYKKTMYYLQENYVWFARELCIICKKTMYYLQENYVLIVSNFLNSCLLSDYLIDIQLIVIIWVQLQYLFINRLYYGAKVKQMIWFGSKHQNFLILVNQQLLLMLYHTASTRNS